MCVWVLCHLLTALWEVSRKSCSGWYWKGIHSQVLLSQCQESGLLASFWPQVTMRETLFGYLSQTSEAKMAATHRGQTAKPIPSALSLPAGSCDRLKTAGQMFVWEASLVQHPPYSEKAWGLADRAGLPGGWHRQLASRGI